MLFSPLRSGRSSNILVKACNTAAVTSSAHLYDGIDMGVREGGELPSLSRRLPLRCSATVCDLFRGATPDWIDFAVVNGAESDRFRVGLDVDVDGLVMRPL